MEDYFRRFFFVPNFADVSLQNEKKQLNNTIMKKEKSISGLLNRWVFDHAYAMIDEFNISRKEAFTKAHLARELLEALGQGVVVFEYEKKDGTLRQARGTLCRGISEKYDAYEYKTDSHGNDEYPKLDIAYWDLEKEAFRNFSMVNVKRIVDIKDSTLIEFV